MATLPKSSWWIKSTLTLSRPPAKERQSLLSLTVLVGAPRIIRACVCSGIIVTVAPLLLGTRMPVSATRHVLAVRLLVACQIGPCPPAGLAPFPPRRYADRGARRLSTSSRARRHRRPRPTLSLLSSVRHPTLSPTCPQMKEMFSPLRTMRTRCR